MMKRGRAGALVAGLGFMLPGLVLILLIASLYRTVDLRQPLVAAAFLGIQIGVIALIVRAVHRIADHTLGNPWLWGIASLCAVGAALEVSFWVTLPAAGIVYASLKAHRPGLAALALVLSFSFAAWTSSVGQGQLGASAATLVEQGSVAALPLFMSGLKAGLLTFGGAYTAIPFVRDDAVGRGWVTDGQFLDSLALSGIIPAPLIIFATFVGYLAGGLGGALAMTAGIFLPAFAFALLFYDHLERVVEDERLQGFLEGVAAGVVGLIAVTALQLGWKVASLVPAVITGAALFIGALALLYGWKSKLSVPAVVLASGALGCLAFSPVG